MKDHAKDAMTTTTSDKPSFILPDLEHQEQVLKPLPCSIRKKKEHGRNRITLPEVYPAHLDEFFNLIKDCGVKISELKSSDLKKTFNDELSRIFARRDIKATMRFYFQISNALMGESNVLTDRKTH